MTVMAGLDPAIHVFRAATFTSWMPGSPSAKTRFALLPGHDELRDHAPRQFIVGMENSAPSLTPEGQREVTVLVLV